MKEFISKEKLHELHEAHENARGTKDWYKYNLEVYVKTKTWHFVGHYIPDERYDAYLKTIRGKRYIYQTDGLNDDYRYALDSQTVVDLLGIGGKANEF